MVEFFAVRGRRQGTGSRLGGLPELSKQQKNDLVAFMIGLTDERVRNESKPFDHPSLLIHNGANPDGTDRSTILPAVGAGGRSALGLAPVQRFLGLDPFQP